MTDPTPPRAPVAVPEAVLTAQRAYDRAMEAFCEDRATRRDVDDAQWAVSHAIATALRKATAERDQEIARLKADVESACDNNERIAKFLDHERSEVKRMKAVVEAERSAAATIFDRLRREIAARRPLSQGRECYEWDDDRYRQEFGYALDGIEKIARDMERMCRIHDLTDCPLHWDDVHGAREIARLTVELEAAQADMARLDFLLRHRYETTTWPDGAEIDVQDLGDASFVGPDIRAAIDLARAAEEREG